MPFTFRVSDFKKIGILLKTPPKTMGSNYRYEVSGKGVQRKLVLEIYPDIRIGTTRGNLVSVYTESSHLQLHFCSGYVLSELLGEITFVGEQQGKLSGLIIEREGGCSLYANVDRSLLSGNFTQLGPEVMLSGIALSLTDIILDSPAPSRKPLRKPAPARRRKNSH